MNILSVEEDIIFTKLSNNLPLSLDERNFLIEKYLQHYLNLQANCTNIEWIKKNIPIEYLILSLIPYKLLDINNKDHIHRQRFMIFKYVIPDILLSNYEKYAIALKHLKRIIVEEDYYSISKIHAFMDLWNIPMQVMDDLKVYDIEVVLKKLLEYNPSSWVITSNASTEMIFDKYIRDYFDD